MKHKNDLNFNTKLNGKQRFGFRKLSIGLATVALGTTFFLSNSELVHADVTESTHSQEPTIVNGKDTDADSNQLNDETTKAPTSATSQQNNDQSNNDIETSTFNISNKDTAQTTKALQTTLVKSVTPNNDSNTENSSATADTEQKKDTTTVTEPAKDKMMAGLDTNSTTVTFTNHKINKGDKISVSITSDKPNLITSSSVPTWSDFTDGTVTTDENGITYTYTYDQNGNLDGISDLGFQANKDVVTESETANITITVKQNDDQLAQVSKEITIDPYSDKIKEHELVHAYEMGLKVPQVAAGTGGSYKETYLDGEVNGDDTSKVKGTTVTYTVDDNVSDDDHNLKDPDDPTKAYDPSKRKNIRMVQYGVEWNFGKNTNLKDVVAKLEVSGYENILPSTIKVFRFTPELISKYFKNNTRPDINDFYQDLTEYKNDKYTNEDGNFEAYLRSLVSSPTSQSISIKQDGQFTVNDKTKDAEGNDYDDGVYFIQFDTQIFPKQDYHSYVSGDGTGTKVGIYSSYIPPHKGSAEGTAIEEAMPISDFDNYSEFTVRNSTSKTITEKIIYKYENGPYANKTDEQVSRNINFEQATAILDDGTIITSPWTTGSFDNYQLAQTLPGLDNNKTDVYKIDGKNIKETVTDNNGTELNNRNIAISYDQSLINSKTFDNQSIIDAIPDGTTFTIIVPYKLTENITVHYIDEDDQNGTEISNDQLTTSYTDGNPQSTVENKTNSDIQYLESLGYVFDETATNGGTAHNTNLIYDTSKKNFKTDNNNNSYDSAKLTFDNDEELNNQVYYVYLYHDKTPKTETKTLIETITYVDDNTGNKLTLPGNQSNPYTTQSTPVTFSRTTTKDRITGKQTTTNWTVTGSLSDKENPTIPGYVITVNSHNYTEKLNGKDSFLATKGTDKVGGVDFNSAVSQDQITALPSQSTLAIVVPYKQNNEQANIKYYDDTAEQFIDPNTYSVDSSGTPDSTISFGQNAQTYYNNLIKQHYVYNGITSGQEANGTKITNEDGSNVNFALSDIYGSYDNTDNSADPTIDAEPQYFVVHFTHGINTETQSATVTEKVTYYYENGPHANKDVPASDVNPVNRQVTYTRTRTVDLVDSSKDGNWSDWTTKDDALTAVNIPASLPGHDADAPTNTNIYHIDKDKISAKKNLTNDSSLLNEDKSQVNAINPSDLTDKASISYTVKVPYKLNENITVHYIDEDDNNGTEINKDQLTTSYNDGEPQKTVENNTNSDIQYLESLGYVFDETATNGGTAHNTNLIYDTSKKNFKTDNNSNTYNSDRLTFDNNENPNDQVYYVYLYHGTRDEQQSATVTEVVKGYYANGTKMNSFNGINDSNVVVPENDETGSPDNTVTVTYIRNRTVDLVNDPDGSKTAWSTWSRFSDIPAIAYDNTIIKNSLPDYYNLDKNGVVHIIGQKDGFTVTVDPETGISEIKPSTEYLESIAQTIINGKVTTIGNDGEIDIWIPYTQNIPSQPTNLTNQSTPPTTPQSPTQPTNPTTPVQPTQPTEPVQSSTPVQPTEPCKTTTPKKQKRTPSKPNKWSSNNGPQGEGLDNRRNNSNFRPQGQSYNDNFIPKGQSLNNASSANSVNNKQADQQALPQTGEEKSNLGLIGLSLAALASLIGLVGSRKRKH